MAGKRDITLGVGFNVNDKQLKSSLDGIKKSFQDIQNMKFSDFSGTRKELMQIQRTAGQVEQALVKAFNTNLNSVNVERFNSILSESGLTIDGIYSQFSKLGATGKVAFSQMATSVLTTNMQLKETHSILNDMGTTMMNTVKWGVASSIMNNFTNSVQQAFQYVKSLDSALTDIRIVTGDSTDQMAKFADQANRAAQQLGRSTMDYSKAALTFYQQGLSDEDVQARTEATLKAQNITGAGQEMADYLTAVWNGYKVANQEAELYVDKLAAVADSSASNMSQLAVAMSKVASSANALGVPVDSLNAQIATIVATTRQAPESVGNALKTIYSRINDIATGADDAQISLGNYSSKMAELGFSVLDANGNLRDTGDVLEQIGGQWENLSREQQIYLARTMAGQRQYNNLIALFDNWGKYTDLVTVSMDSQGATMEKNSRYMESLEAHLNQLGTASERFKSSLVDSESFKGLVDIATNLVEVFANFTESIGGGGNALLAFGSIATQVFSGVFAGEINKIVTNFQNVRNNIELVKKDIEMTRQYGQSQGYKKETISAMVDAKRAAQGYYDYMSDAQKNEYNGYVQNIAQANEEVIKLTDLKNTAKEVLDLFSKSHPGIPLQQMDVPLEDAKNKFKELNKELKEFSFDQFSRKVNNLGQGLNPAEAAIARFKNILQELKKASGEDFIKSLKSTEDFAKILESTALSAEEKAESLRIVLLKIIKEGNIKLDIGLNSDKVEADLDRAEKKFELAKQAAEDYLNTVKQTANIQSIVSGVAAIGQLASAYNNLSNIVKIWKNENLTAGQKITQSLMNLSSTAFLVVNGFSALSKSYNTILNSIGANIIAHNQQQLQIYKTAVAKKVEAGASEEAAAAEVLHAMGLQSVAGSAATAMAAIAPYALAVAAIGVVIYAAVKSWNAASDAAERAAKTAGEAKEAYNSIRKQAQEVKTSFEDLKSAQDNLDSLTKGTDEWKDALQDVNSKVIELVDRFPQLRDQIGTTADGMLYLKQGAQQLVTAMYDANQAAAAMNYITAQKASTAAENRSSIVDASRQITQTSENAVSAQDLEKAVDAVNQFGNWILQDADALSKHTGILLPIAQDIVNHASYVDKLATEVRDNTTATNNLTTAFLKSELTGTPEYQDSGNKEAWANLYEKKASQVKLGDQYYKTNGYRSQGLNNGQQLVIDEQKVLDQYAKINNIARQRLRIVEDHVQIQDNTGKWSEHLLVSLMNQKVAADDAGGIVQLVAQDWQKVTNHAQQLKSAVKITQDALSDVDNININTVSRENIRDLYKASDETLKDIFGEGFDTTAFRDSLLQMYVKINDQWKDFVGKLPQTIQDAFKEMNINPDKYSLEAAESLSNILKKSLEKGGAQGFDLAKILLKDIQPQDVKPLEDIFNSIDFSKLNVEDFKSQLSEAGIELNQADLYLNDFIQKLIDLQNAVNPEELYKNIHGVIDGLSDGDIISEQQAAILSSAGINVDQYFSQMLDGSYKLQAGAQQFYNFVNGLTLQPFIQRINQELSQNSTLGGLGQYVNSSGGLDNFFSSAMTGQRNAEGVQTYDNELLGQQLQFLQAIGVKSQEIDDIQYRYGKNLELTVDQVNKVSEVVEQNKERWNEIPQIIEKNNELIEKQTEQLVNSVQTFDQLQKLVDSGLVEEGSDLYKQGRENAIEAAAERVGVSTDVYQAYADGLKEAMLANEDFIGTAEDAAQVSEEMAEQMYQLNQGLEDLQDSWKKYSENIKEGAEDTPQYAQAVGSLSQAIEQMFGVPVSSNFVTENLEQIRALAQGDISVIDELAAKATADYVMQIRAQVDDVQAQAQLAWLSDYIANMQLDDIQIGTSLDDTGLVDALNQMLADLTITEQQANNILKGIGYTPKITYKEVTMDSQSQSDTQGQSNTETTIDFPVYDGTSIVTVPTTFHTTNTQGASSGATQGSKVMVPQIDAEGTKYTGASTGAGISNGARAPRSGGGGGGKGGGGKGKGGGGKSGSSTQTKQPQRAKGVKITRPTKHIEAERDAYHDVNLALEKQEDILKDLNEEEERLVPLDRLKVIQQTNKQLKQQQSLLNQKDAIAAGELVRLRNQLIKDLGQGISFGPDGQIANYNQALKNAADKYNQQIDLYNEAINKAEEEYNDWIENTYNKKSAQQQQNLKTQMDKRKDQLDLIKEKAKIQLDDNKEIYDSVVKNIKEYQKTLQLQEDIAQDIREIQEEILDNLIRRSKIKVDVSLEAGQLERDWLKFENKFIKKIDRNDFLGNAKASTKELMSYFDSKQIQQTTAQIKKIQEDIVAISQGGKGKIYSYQGIDNLEQAKEDLQEYMDQLMNDLMDVQDLIDDIKDDYLDAIDDAKDKMDDQIDQYDRIGDLIEHNIKLSEMLYGDQAYDTLNKYYDLQQKNNYKALASLRSSQDYWLNKMNQEIEGSEAWKAFRKNWQDATDEINNKMQQMVSNLGDKFANSLQAAIDKVNKNLTGGFGTDYLEQEWDTTQMFDDKFLDTFESTTGINEIARLYSDAAGELAGNPKAQAKMNDLMEDQLKILRQKDHLTEYDLERAKASLEVEKARLALEQARDNKTKMRLRRDSQGNYTYQYVADEQKLGELQTALADAQSQLYNTDKQHYKQNLNDLYDTYKEYLEKRAELEQQYRQAYASGDKDEIERVQAKIDQLDSAYEEYYAGLLENNQYLLNTYLSNSFADGLSLDKAKYSAQEYMQIMKDNIPGVSSSIQSMNEDIRNQGGLLIATKDAVLGMRDATIEYKKETDKVLKTGGTSTDTLLDVVDKQGKALDKNIQQAQSLEKYHKQVIKAAKDEIESIRELLGWLNDFLIKVGDVESRLSALRSAYNTLQGLNGVQSTAEQNPQMSNFLDTTTDTKYSGNPKMDLKKLSSNINALMGQYEKFLSGMAIASFDEGGMTGSWADAEGRLAFLHTKELVLNQNDTANILAAVQAIRSLTSSMDIGIGNELSSLQSNTIGMIAGMKQAGDFLQQAVHIDAHFPNVTQHNEIEQAFNNLVNMASMHASKYKN